MTLGTAGVWRIKAIEDAGGWKDRTTVEDMDLAVRASLKGWKFVFVGDLEVSFISSINFMNPMNISTANKQLKSYIGKKRTPKYLQSLSISTASMVMWSS